MTVCHRLLNVSVTSATKDVNCCGIKPYIVYFVVHCCNLGAANLIQSDINGQRVAALEV